MTAEMSSTKCSDADWEGGAGGGAKVGVGSSGEQRKRTSTEWVEE